MHDMTPMLYHQADNILHESIISLRKENSQLQVEMNDLKQEVGLQIDQVSYNLEREIDLANI